MAAIPAETSQPGRRRLRSGGSSGDPFWAVIVLLAFMLALYWLAKSTVDLAADDAANPSVSGLVGSLVALVFVLAVLIVYSTHPRTRSDAATFSFTIMKGMMLLGGVILFVGGLTNALKTDEFNEQVILASLALFYVMTPLILHFAEK